MYQVSVDLNQINVDSIWLSGGPGLNPIAGFLPIRPPVKRWKWDQVDVHFLSICDTLKALSHRIQTRNWTDETQPMRV